METTLLDSQTNCYCLGNIDGRRCFQTGLVLRPWFLSNTDFIAHFIRLISVVRSEWILKQRGEEETRAVIMDEGSTECAYTRVPNTGTGTFPGSARTYFFYVDKIATIGETFIFNLVNLSWFETFLSGNFNEVFIWPDDIRGRACKKAGCGYLVKIQRNLCCFRLKQQQ